MKTLLFTTLAIVALGLNTSHAITHTLSGTMDVSQAGTNGGFGSGSGNGTGTISGDYDDVTDLLNYTLIWQDLSDSATNIHFHLGAPGVSGGVVVGVSSPFTSPLTGSATLGASAETDLLAGNLYVNVHTTAFGGGEIRGQVLATQVPEPTTACLATMAFLSVVSLARRKR